MTIDAVSAASVMLESRGGGRERKLTLEELLARVFLEECLVGYWSGEVLHHEFEDGLNLVFGVSSIMS